MLKIEPVGRFHRSAAMRCLVAQCPDTPLARERAAGFERLLRSREGSRTVLWWARQEGRIRGAALVLACPGRTGMLFHSPLVDAVEEANILGELIGQISRACLADGLTLVQALIEPGSPERAVLEQAGFVRLAELVYMEMPVSAARPEINSADLRWRSYDEFSQDELAQVIASTYEGTLDCPALSGLRNIKDVIAGHKVSGLFSRQWWWIVDWQSQPAGCLLMNRMPSSPCVDIVYLGVVPGFRGRGLGRAMVRHGAWSAAGADLTSLTLAVDSSNHYAYNLYESEGFRENDRRLAFILAGGRP